MVEPLIIERGHVLAYRLYDVADEIDLQKVAAVTTQAARRLRLQREYAEFLAMPNPPVAFDLGTRKLELRAGPTQVGVSARMFDFGCVSVSVTLPLAAGLEFADIARITDEAFDSKALDALTRKEAELLCADVKDALHKPHSWESSEGYHVVFVEKFTTRPTANDILERANLARMLVGEPGEEPLSDRERYDVTKNAFSYLKNDLAVVDWNCAFVYEPSGSHDIPDILEMANAQLLELRYYDDVLDRELARIYEIMEKKRSRLGSIFRSDYRRLLRNVMVLMLEIDEFTERVENSLKIIGDFYLARVFRGAVRRLRLANWHQSVDRKQALLSQVYGLLKGEVDTDRAVLLEATIIALIVFEIVMALAGTK